MLDQGKAEREKHLNTRQVAERLGIKSTTNIFNLIKSNKFPNAYQDTKTRKWYIPITDVEKYEERMFTSVGVPEASERLKISEEILLNCIYENKFPNCHKEKWKWKIPLSDIENYKRKIQVEESIPISDAIRLLSLKDSVKNIIKENYFSNVSRVDNEWKVPISEVEEFRRKSFAAKDYVDLDAAANILKIPPTQIFNRIKNRKFAKVFKFKGRWLISKKDISDFKATQKRSIENTLTTKEAAARLGYKHQATINKMITKEKSFPNSFKVGGLWRIPLTDIKEFERSVTESQKKIDYTSELMFKELKNKLDSIDISKEVKETKEIYLRFCLLHINNMKGTSVYKRSRIGLFNNLFQKLMLMIKKELYLMPSDEISNMLKESSILRQHEKKLLIVFLKYMYHQKNMEPDQEFSLISNVNQKKEQDIYSPELFNKIYQYIKDVDKHTSKAIKDRYYANMWVYTILLLTDFIRGQDLILNTPNIDIETVDIHSVDWFLDNELNEYQSQVIINQLYTHFRHKRTSKTDELLTFIVAPDLNKPLATALLISELLRRLDQSTLQLDSFFAGKFNDIRTQGKVRHKNFFNEMEGNAEFRFSSLIMNRSVATYLFYSVMEEDGEDSDLALHLTQISRSHKKSDTTSQYIQSTNKDGPINRVSYNLFKRGHFGWLYNYLILYTSNFENKQSSLEQRSNLIEQIRKEITPLDLESAAKFVNNNLSVTPLKIQSNSMEGVLEEIYKKRQSIISKLKNYSSEEIRKVIKKLSKGELPSKTEHAQCLVSPNCRRLKLTDCFSCEYVIPGNLMLIQLNEELKRLLNNIKKATNTVILLKESKFLMHALFIWKEARLEFGDDHVEAYIDARKIWEKIENVAHKIISD